MNAFLMHVGHNNTVDLAWTVSRRRTLSEIVDKLPCGPERDYFEKDEVLKTAFPRGEFNCWGVPEGAEPAHTQTEVGDLVLFAPHIGIHGGGVRFLGLVKAIPRGRFPVASRILWPETPNGRIFPWLFFFDSEAGDLDWYEFLRDAGYGEQWNPRGWYKYLQNARFSEYGGAFGYVQHLRKDKGFSRAGTDDSGTIRNHP